LRGDYKQSEYGKIVLPFTVLRRLDSLPNTTGLRLPDLANRPDRLRHYIGGFSVEVRDIFDCFGFTAQIARLKRSGLLSLLIHRFCEIDLGPEAVSNHEMGSIFEELIRKFAEQSNETAGEHFTPREVVHLMVRLVFADGSADGKTLYDPACGTGGMLSIADELVHQHHPASQFRCYGQELNPESCAIASADALLSGREIHDIALGNIFTSDGFASRKFDYMLSNPPFGVAWKKVERLIRQEHEKLGFGGRFGAGLPRVNDGSLLFLQHMLSKMRPEGSRIAVVFNGSPLFAGDAGSGESEIRRWIIENDWLEAVIALPDQLFYNTGLATYIWVLANHKISQRRGKVQLINAAGFAEKMRRSLGAKRNQIPPSKIDEICGIYREFGQSRYSRILRNEELGYRRIVIERPVRLSFQATAERIRSLQDRFGPAVLDALAGMDPGIIYRDQAGFDAALFAVFRRAGLKLGRTLARRIRELLSCQDDQAEIYRDAKGRPVADAALRDSESIPLDLEIEPWFEREVRPHAPDAWIAPQKPLTGYSIPLARVFFQPEPVRSLDEIDREIRDLEQETRALLEQVQSA
jgi:type I restriction enzyme M protein